MDAIDVIISQLSLVDREFYQECADRVGLYLHDWMARIDEI